MAYLIKIRPLNIIHSFFLLVYSTAFLYISAKYSLVSLPITFS